MPYPAKIQPIDFNQPPNSQPKCDAAVNPVLKSRFKRLFERPFSSVLKTPRDGNKDGLEEFEPSSVCLANMVQNFIEESNEKQQKCGRNRCNCFNRENSDEEKDSYTSSVGHAIDVLKNLIPCLSITEKNLLADTARIVEKNKITRRRDDLSRKIIVGGLIDLEFNASICKSKWEKTSSIPTGEHEYVDVIIEAERFIVETDFRSEFEIARPTKAYKQILQTLPNIFVGKPDRLKKIITIVSDAARQSLKTKGMPFPPWRKGEYMEAKWLSPATRIGQNNNNPDIDNKNNQIRVSCNDILKGSTPVREYVNSVITMKKWEPQPLEIKPKSLHKGAKIVTGLASVIED